MAKPLPDQQAGIVRDGSRLSDFPLEWLALLGLGVLEVPLAAHWGISIAFPPGCFLCLIGALALSMTFRTIVPRRTIALGADYLALTLFTAAISVVLTYLAAAPSYPLVDSQMIRIDRALGFDWLFCFRLAIAHPSLMNVLYFCYDSFIFQSLFFTVLFAASDRKDRLQEMFWGMMIALFLTTAVFAVLPTLGAFSVFGLAHRVDINLHGADGYLNDLEAIRSKTHLHFVMGKMCGIINFPSYHTVLAIIFSYCFRRSGVVGWVVCLLNLGMLIAIPVVGGHYLVDIISGAVIAVLSIVVVRQAMRRLFRADWEQQNAAVSFQSMLP
jgi:hypothetical protein